MNLPSLALQGEDVSVSTIHGGLWCNDAKPTSQGSPHHAQLVQWDFGQLPNLDLRREPARLAHQCQYGVLGAAGAVKHHLYSAAKQHLFDGRCHRRRQLGIALLKQSTLERAADAILLLTPFCQLLAIQGDGAAALRSQSQLLSLGMISLFRVELGGSSSLRFPTFPTFRPWSHFACISYMSYISFVSPYPFLTFRPWSVGSPSRAKTTPTADKP